MKQIMDPEFAGSVSALINEADSVGDGQISMADGVASMMLDQTPAAMRRGGSPSSVGLALSGDEDSRNEI